MADVELFSAGDVDALTGELESYPDSFDDTQGLSVSVSDCTCKFLLKVIVWGRETVPSQSWTQATVAAPTPNWRRT